MFRRECYESKKKRTDGVWLNPKHFINGQSASKLRTAKGSTTKLPQVFGGTVVSILNG